MLLRASFGFFNVTGVVTIFCGRVATGQPVRDIPVISLKPCIYFKPLTIVLFANIGSDHKFWDP